MSDDKNTQSPTGPAVVLSAQELIKVQLKLAEALATVPASQRYQLLQSVGQLLGIRAPNRQPPPPAQRGR